MIIFFLFIFVFVVSFDSFSVGLIYGFWKVKILLKFIFIILCCLVFFLMFFMFLGKVFMYLFLVDVLNKVGGGIFVLFGMWILY